METGTTRDSALVAGRIVAQHRDRYIVRIGGVDHDAVLSGQFRHTVACAEDLPTVGDEVQVSAPANADDVVQLHRVQPRRTVIRRTAAGRSSDAQVLAANVDVVIIATALPHDVNLRRLERYLTVAWDSGATPLIVLTKSDLVEDVGVSVAEVRGVAPGVDVIAISTLTGSGVAELRARLVPAAHASAGLTAVIVGSSGVGKSTLVNALLGESRLRTNAVRADGAGRHTTTHRELLELPGGGALIDTPGMRELQLSLAEDGFSAAFQDISALADECRFGDCGHGSEPGCAVQAALEDGRLDLERLESWRGLRKELAALERRTDVAAMRAAKGYAKSTERMMRVRLREKGQ